MSQIRNTLQRDLVREVMRDNYDHPTAEETFEIIHAKHPHVSFATVYRNLNLLASQGEITRLHMPEGPDHYDASTDQHYHFLCRKCHRILDTEVPYSDSLDRVAPAGCKAEGHILTLIGLCPDCQKEGE